MNKFLSILLLCIIGITVIVSDSGVNDATARADQRSLLIIFDATKSMGPDLAQLSSAAREIVNDFFKRTDNPIFNYILVVFRDPGKFIYIVMMK